MEKEAVARIKRMMTPEVTLESCADAAYGIHAVVKHTYQFPYTPDPDQPRVVWSKTFTVLADKVGNVFSAPGVLN